MIKLLVRIPGPPRDVLRRRGIEEHVQLLRLASDRPHALNQVPLLQGLQSLGQLVLRDVGGRFNVARPNSSVA
jgi:hypothetical protein